MSEEPVPEPEVNKNKRYRKPKPWDTDDINHWEIVPVFKETPSFLEESSFATLFPKYRENYLRQVWPQITISLEAYVSIFVIKCAIPL